MQKVKTMQGLRQTDNELLFFNLSVPLGSIQELPAETCDEIKRSEGHAISGKYWFSTIKSGTSVLAYCNMETNGEFSQLYNRQLPLS